MPIVQVQMWEGRTEDQKERIAKEITDIMVSVAKAPRDAVTVVFTEYKRTNWAEGGILARDLTE